MQTRDGHVQREVHRREAGKLKALALEWIAPAPPPFVDQGEKRAQLAGLGLTPEQVNEQMARLEAAAKGPAPQAVPWQGEHERAYAVFQRCPVECTGVGMAGVAFTGIRPSEIEIAARALRFELTPELLDDVTYMGHVAARKLSDKAKPRK